MRRDSKKGAIRWRLRRQPRVEEVGGRRRKITGSLRGSIGIGSVERNGTEDGGDAEGEGSSSPLLTLSRRRRRHTLGSVWVASEDGGGCCHTGCIFGGERRRLRGFVLSSAKFFSHRGRDAIPSLL